MGKTRACKAENNEAKDRLYHPILTPSLHILITYIYSHPLPPPHHHLKAPKIKNPITPPNHTPKPYLNTPTARLPAPPYLRQHPSRLPPLDGRRHAGRRRWWARLVPLRLRGGRLLLRFVIVGGRFLVRDRAGREAGAHGIVRHDSSRDALRERGEARLLFF